MKNNMFKKVVLVGIVVLACCGAPKYTFSLESEQFRIEQGQVGQSDEQDTTVVVRDPVTIDPARIKSFNDHGYSGLVSDIPLRLTIDNTTIDYGNDPITRPVIKSAEYSVSYRGDTGYTIGVLGQYGSHSSKKVYVPAACDDSCTIEHADEWTADTTGYGYSIKGPDADRDFGGGNRYRLFNVDTPRAVAAASSTGSIQPRKYSLVTRFMPPSGTQLATYPFSVTIALQNDW